MMMMMMMTRCTWNVGPNWPH